jgi:hypothetical protein
MRGDTAIRLTDLKIHNQYKHNVLQAKMTATDLNSICQFGHDFPASGREGVAEAFRTDRVCSGDERAADARVSQVRTSLPMRTTRSHVLLPRSVSLHGSCPVDVPRIAAGHRDVFTSGIGQAVSHGDSRAHSRSTMADANEGRDWRIYTDFAQVLIGTARQLYIDETLAST